MKYIIKFCFLVCVVLSQIQLTKVPSEMLTYGKIKDGDKKSEVDIQWLPYNNPENIASSEVFFRFSKTPGLVSNVSETTSKRVLLTVSNLGVIFKPAALPTGGDFPLGGEIKPGVYYCYIQDRSSVSTRSVEFQLIIEADTSPLNFNPTDGNLSTNGNLSWEDPENDSPPYFHVMVSDRPIKLRDEGGEVKIDSAKIVYQAIVPRSILGGSIQYGIPDPSGHFANASTVPLVHDHTYYWAVLNNYGNHPALTSSVTPSKIASFVYKNAATYLPETNLSSPANGSTIDKAESIRFSWSAISGASPDYELNIYEVREQDGNTFSFLVKQVVLNSTSTEFLLSDAQSSLRTTGYNWNIIAKDGEKVSVSKTRNFNYIAPASSTMKIRTLISGTSNSLARATLNIFPKGASDTELLTYYSDGGGYFYREYIHGTYIVKAKKDGYKSVEQEVILDSSLPDTISVNIQLPKVETILSGSISVPSSSNQPKVRLVKYTSLTDSTISYHGAVNSETTSETKKYNFQIFADATGTDEFYKIYPSLSNHTTSDTITTTTISEGQTRNFSYTLSKINLLSNVTFQVIDKAGQPVKNAAVNVVQGSNQESLLSNQYGQVITKLTKNVLIEVDAKKLNYTFSDPIQYLPTEDEVSLTLELARNPLFTGVIKDLRNNPIAKAEVTLSNANITKTYVTGSSGSFQFSTAPGSYSISIKQSDYEDLNTTISLSAGVDLLKNYQLNSLESSIYGKISLVNNASEYVEGLKVSYVVIGDGAKTGETLTASDGSYSLSVPTDSILVTVSALGYLSTEKGLKIPINKDSLVDFSVYKDNAGISGTIQNSSGQNLRNVEIIAYDQTNTISHLTNTNSSGQYYLKLKPNTTYSKIRYEFSGFVSIDTLKNTNVTYEESILFGILTLDSLPQPIQGTVKGFGGALLKNARVVTNLNDTVFTNSLGEFSFEGKGQTSITIHKVPYNDTTFVTANNQTHSITMSYDYVNVSGRVTDDSSLEGINEATLTFYSISGGAYSGSVKTNTTGQYSINLPPERKYSFIVSKDRYKNSASYTVDATSGSDVTVNKALEQVIISDINIQPLGFDFDLENHVTLRSSDSLFFSVVGIDTSSGLPVGLDGLKWTVESGATPELDALVSISENGVISFDPSFISDGLKVFVEDTIGGVVNDTIELSVLAQLKPSLGVSTFKDIDGFELNLNANYVTDNQLIALRKRTLPSALQSSLNGRVLPTTFDIFFVTTDNVTENNSASTINLPVNVSDNGYVLVKWDDSVLDWIQIDGGSVSRSKSTGNLPFSGFGQYGLMRLSKSLNLSGIEVLPNPFSPLVEHQELLGSRDVVDGEYSNPYGTNILFVVDSEGARKPVVNAKIYNFRGNLIRTLIDNSPRSTGLNVVQWDGKTDNNEDARNGRYILVLKVKDSSGEKTQLKQIVMVK